MKVLTKLTAYLTLIAAAIPAAAMPEASLVGLLRAQDLRIAPIADRLLTANASLCRNTMPVAGFSFHTIDQYNPSVASTLFTMGNAAIASVTPNSSAARTRMRADDALLTVNEQTVDSLEPVGESPARDAIFDYISNLPADAPLQLGLSRDGEDYSVTLMPQAGCRALVEIRSESEIGARSDGRVIQVNYGLAKAASDDELAVVFAHELAHVVLEHRRRLSEAGVSKGFFGEFGRNQQLNRQVEVEADRMAVHLLANAGYDPTIAPKFFRSALGRKAGRDLLSRSATYPSPEARADLVEREIADYLAAGSPSWPGHLLSRRDEAFD